ncbi:MFS transporter [Rhizobium oryzicola]|uniref:MFS transporter n=1 Tax=Rhizobium oryzicola TaxID=1232668 RepID=A0ABT8SYR7_9HYPH|nr:MFS transporter [Rhizobium oryzicola]MDO1583415.1 MFS transporter [Rhizobium oryzicola]
MFITESMCVSLSPSLLDGTRHPGLVHTLLVATAVQVFATASVLALTALAGVVASDLGIEPHWIGYQISAIYAVGVFSSATAGTLVARFGASRIEQVAIGCSALGFLCLATGQSAMMLLGTASIGVGYGLNNPASSQLLSRVTPVSRRNIVFSIKQSGVPLGGVVASVLFPVMSQRFGWRETFVIAGLLCLVLLVWLALTHKDAPDARRPGGSLLKDFAEVQALVWRNRSLRTLSLLGLIYSAMQLSMSAFAVLSLTEEGRMPLLMAGSIAAAMQLSGAFGRIGWGVMADRLGGGFVTLGLIGLLSGLCCVALFWLGTLPPPLQILLFICMGGLSIGWNGVLLAEIARASESGRVGAFTGGVLVYTFIGVIFGPSLFAQLVSVAGSYGVAFLMFSATGFIGAILAFHYRR